MITKEQAMAARHRQEFYGTSIRDGRKPITVRVNGACKTWKTRPAEWSLPIKHGLYACDYLTPDNAHRFYMTAEERDATV